MIPIAIVAHSSRAERAENLAYAVQAEALTVDNGNLGPGRNHVVAWEWLTEGHSAWSVVLEDDAIPAQDFQNQLKAVLDKAPSPVVSLYLGRGRPRQWQPAIQQIIQRPEHWVRAPELLHHVGVAVRTSYVSSMLNHLHRQNLATIPIDEAIGVWTRTRRVKVSYCLPSIVDHEERLPTTILEHHSLQPGETGTRDHPREVRKAWRFGTRRTWNSSLVEMPDPVIVLPSPS